MGYISALTYYLLLQYDFCQSWKLKPQHLWVSGHISWRELRTLREKPPALIESSKFCHNLSWNPTGPPDSTERWCGLNIRPTPNHQRASIHLPTFPCYLRILFEWVDSGSVNRGAWLNSVTNGLSCQQCHYCHSTKPTLPHWSFRTYFILWRKLRSVPMYACVS